MNKPTRAPGNSAASVDALVPRQGRNLWLGGDLRADRDRWLYRFSDAELAELHAATHHYAATGRDVVDLRRDDFELPGLAKALATVRDEVVHGRGFFVLRGFDPSACTQREAAIAFYGIGTHFGRAVSQNAKGHALGHVRDLGFDYNAPTARGYQTNHRLPYHSDGSDLAALLCLRTAVRGGHSSVVNSLALFNTMLERRPDLAELLTHPLYRDRRGEIPEGCEPWYRMPVFNLFKGEVLTSYVRSTVRKAQRFPQVPRITPELDEAMDMVDALAADPDIHFDMSFEPGDMQFVNNHTVLHSRTGFVDHPDPEQRRHLLRLWLAAADGPALPEPYAEFQGLNADGRPNGYKLAAVSLNTPLDAHDGGPGGSGQRHRANA